MHPPSESTATFIKINLLESGVDYPYNLYRKWKAYLHERGMKAPKWDSFKVYFRTVERAGLVTRTATPPDVEEYKGHLKPAKRTYYKLVEERLGDHEAWRNPQVAVFGDIVRLGRERYRKRKARLQAKRKRGRPRL